LAGFGGSWDKESPFASDFSSTFYIGKRAATSLVRACTKTGTLGTTYNLGTGAIHSLGVDTANTTLFFTGDSVGSPMKTWDIGGNVAGPNLVAGVANFAWPGRDILVIPGTNQLLTIVQPSTLTVAYQVNRYEFPSGTLLSTYPLTGDVFTISDARLSLDLGSPSVAFWVRTFPDATGLTSQLIQFNIATGFPVTSFTINNDSTDPTKAPLSCPFFAFSNNGGGGGGGLSPVFVGTAATMPIRRERTVPIPVADGNARQTISRLEVQFQPGTGIVDDPLGEPKFMLQVSWDHGKTWSNERLMNAGREGRYLTRAYVNIVGQGRYPVVRIVTSDTFLPIMTGCSVWITESAH
jgi:hypothetical protein